MKIDKRVNKLLLLLCALLVVGSYSFQYMLDLQPCPLCMMQRFCAIALVLTALFSLFLQREKWRIFLSFLFAVFNVFALYFSSRQLYLQANPDLHLACAPGFDALLEYFPYQDIFYALFWGSGDCAEVSWRFLGLSLATWSFLSFVVVFITYILGLKKHHNVTSIAK